ncbi:sensor histidine kinase [Longirhabdus pacifica]|uniref:sensor histidine kinase n=1 Tax=Longirhabdus pacifica TaxID=2305227 RepID=UPI0013E8C254|nr:sensor histidine kinase [Longirhabdus pacifica]
MLFKKWFHSKGKVFHRILWMNSIIMLVFMLILFLVVWNYYNDVVAQRELDKNTRTLERIETYFNHKQDYVRSVFNGLHQADKVEIIEGISYFVNHTYTEYYEYKLNKYKQNPSSIPNDFEQYVYDSFIEETDVVAVTITGTENEANQYTDAFHYYDWSKIQKGEAQSFTVVKGIRNPGTLIPLAEAKVYYNFDGIQHFVETSNERNEHIYIYDRDKNVIFSNGNALLDEILPVSSETGLETLSDHDYYVNRLFDERTGLLIVGVIPSDGLVAFTFVHFTIIIVTFTLCMFAIIVTYLTMRKYAKRIDMIVQSMEHVQRGNLKVQIPDDSQEDELTTISNSFNKMLTDLNHYINIVYVSEIKQKEAKMKALQSQINPHFLYNTLETIRMKAIAEGSKTTSQMIMYLGKMFRYSLHGKDVVRVEDELAHVHHYLNLFQIRYHNTLQVEEIVSDKLKVYKMLKFTIQPIIENYLIHGIRKTETSNVLQIKFEEKDERLVIVIKDNGKGIRPDRLQQIRDMLSGANGMGDSLGMQNVHERIQLMYGESYGLHVDSVLDQGTTVSIFMPVQQELIQLTKGS